MMNVNVYVLKIEKKKERTEKNIELGYFTPSQLEKKKGIFPYTPTYIYI